MSARCERCGAALPETLLDGSCPRCLALAALGGGEAAGSSPADDYELLNELGRGGMGVVYLARQRTLDRLVAVKVLAGGAHAGAAAEQRFLREAREAARLRHPHIVAIHEVGRRDGLPFYSMDLIEGGDLGDFAARRRLAPREAAGLLVKIARAVQHAHDAGLLHRDLKPANILIDEAGEPHLTDFGLVAARDTASGLTSAGEVLGSPGYMAPEQLHGTASVASDVYALGAILYFLLTARPPFVAAELPQLLAAVERGEPLPPRRLDPSLPRDLETITLHALAREPATRYASATALADDLTRWLGGRVIHARPASWGERAWRWSRRNRALAAVTLGLGAAITLGVAGIAWQWLRAEQAARDTARHLYSADLKVASDALHSGDLGVARRALERCPRELRDTAWGLLWPLVAGEAEATLGSARWTVTSLAVSPDGALAASAAQHDVVRLWDARSAGAAGELPGTTLSWWAAFAPDGRTLFTADERVKQWDVTRRALVREFPGRSGAISPDGRVLYTCAGHRFPYHGEAGPVAAWRVADGAPLFALDGPARGLALSRDGTRLVVWDGAALLRLFDTRDGRPASDPWPAGGDLWHLEFSPDGTQLVGSGWSTAVRVWALDALPAAPRLLEHPLGTWETAFSPDGATLAVACSDRQVHLWDVRTWQRRRTLRGHYNEVWSLAWLADGRLLSAGRDPRLLRWRPETADTPGWLRHDGPSYRLACLPGDRLATLRLAPGAPPTTVVASVREPGAERAFPGETVLGYEAGRDWLWLWTEADELLARRATTLDEVARVPLRLTAGEALVDYPAINATAGCAWAALSDGSLVVHDLGDGRRRARHADLALRRPWAAAMSPDGRRFVWGGVSTELFHLDLVSGARTPLAGHRYEVNGVVFAPDGTWFGTAGTDGLLFAWETATGRLLRPLGQHATSAGGLAIAADARVLVSLEPGVGLHLWHPATDREVGFIAAREEGTNQWMGLAPDGRWLALRETGGSVRVLRVAAADEVP